MRKPSLKPGTLSREELLERRISDLERMMRRLPARDVPGGVDANTNIVQQTAHGLSIKDPIRHNGSAWIKSQADTAANAVVCGIVVAVLSPDVFVMATAGYVAGLSGLTAGAVHYLSASTAGALTTTKPTISVPVLQADSTTSGIILSLGLGQDVVPRTLPSVSSYDEGNMMYVDSTGAWVMSRGPHLGDNPLTTSSTQGFFGVVSSNDGDYITLSSGGVEIYDRSVSTGAPLIKINIGHASLTSTARQIAVREIDVCDAGVAKKMLVLASAPY